MSHSYRKNNFCSIYGNPRMKGWRVSENKRLRHKMKQEVETCTDYDVLILSVTDKYNSLWNSPRGGKMRPLDIPHMNECEIELSKILHERGTKWVEWHKRYYKYSDGHFLKKCNCYNNRRSYYWKSKRK